MALTVRLGLFRTLLACLAITLVISFFLGFIPLVSNTSSCDCSKQSANPTSEDVSASETWSAHHLAVIVPFRDRFEELLIFAPHIHKFLNAQGIKHTIYIVNQVDDYRFNRASLINIGFIQSRNECDYIVMHDVDLLPLNTNLSYAYPKDGPFHIASPELHPLYHYKTFVGGILLLTKEHFLQLNGMSNKYWGWGREDDEFYARMKKFGLTVRRPTGISTGTDGTFQHIHDRRKRRRDTAKASKQREASRQLDMRSGVTTTSYKLVKRYMLSIDGTPVIVLNVELFCDHVVTPWCNHSDTAVNKKMA